MKHFLCIAYLFPPQGGGGVQRTVKFLKYLADFGWRATVLTAPLSAHAPEKSLSNDIPLQTEVVRVRGIELPARLPWRVRNWLTQWLLIVDAQIGWLPFAVRRGAELLRHHHHDALYSTSAPYTAHLVALALRRRTAIPWVADFRDPWLDNFSGNFATPLHRWICARLEKQIVSAADCVVVVSEPMRQQFLQRYPSMQPMHFINLPNGYDRADYVQAAPLAKSQERFTLVYTGSLYGKQQSGRFILDAIRQLLASGAIPREWFAFWLVGATGQEAATLIQRWELADVVTTPGYLPHAEMIRYQLAADALLLIIGQGPGSQAVFTGKIFEYLAVSKPILALTAPSAAVDLLQEAGGAVIVPPDDVPAIMAALLDLFNAWQRGALRLAPNPDVVARHDRRLLAQQLGKILDDLCH